jgi:chromate transporter
MDCAPCEHPLARLLGPADEVATARTRLGEIALLFLKLGTVAFGGPAAHIAMMEDEVVRRRGWLSREDFLDYLGATNLIPGPNSTELAIHIGHARGGWRGLLVAGASFILPATFIVSAIAWAYVRFGTLPAMQGVLYGIKPVVIAVVVQALWRLGRTALKGRLLALLAAAAAGATVFGLHELLVLASAALAMALIFGVRRLDGPPGRPAAGVVGGILKGSALVGASGAVAAPFALGTLFAVFLKIGAVLFGSGYVLLAFLRADLVERLGWLTERQLLDAVAVGQITPGPVFTTATFIGYLLGGVPGAVVATVGIFLPAFIFVALSGLILPRLRRSPLARAVLDAVNVASLALMAVVTWQLGVAALVDLVTVALAAASALLLLRYQVNSAWLILGGAAIGLLVRG